MPPDFGSPVAGPQTAFSPNQGLTTLSNLYGLTQQQQQLQLQRQALQVGGAEVQKAQREQDARGFLTGMMQSGRDDLGQNIRDPVTGEMDPVKVSQAIGRKLPADLAQPVLQNILLTQNNKIGVMEASRALSQKENEDIAGIVQSAGLGTDPQVVMKRMDQYASTNPQAAPLVNNAKPFIQMIANASNPDERLKLAGRLTSMLQTSQAVQKQPGQVNIPTGGNVLSGTTAPPVAEGGGAFTPTSKTPMTPPPAGAQYVYDQYGNAYLAPGGGGGGGSAPGPAVAPSTAPAAPRAPGAGGGGGASAPAPSRFGLPPYLAPGEAATISDIQKEVEGMRTAGTQIGINRDINRRILTLSTQATTGPGTQFIHQVAAAAGLPGGASYQELNSFLDRQAATAAQAMGLPNTNMGLETSKQFTGNTQLDNKVIADKTKFVDSLNDAAQKYLAGANRAVGTGAHPDYTAYQKFRALWSQNFDPEIFAFEKAFQSGDTQEMQRIRAELGSRGMRELHDKRQALIGAVNGQ